MSAPTIAVEGLTCSAPGGHFDILRDVSFTVEEGDHVSVIGPNGAGKTTLLRCLMRILPASAGRISIAGRPIAGYRQRDLARRVAYVPQVEGRFFPFTVRELVAMGRYPYSRPFVAATREDERAVDSALERTQTLAFANRRLESLSGGERQKVLVAAALAQETPILLLDEPTAFLDYRHQVDVERILRAVNRDDGVTVITVTHDLNIALSWSRRALAIRDGMLAFDGSVEDLLRGGMLESIYDIGFERADRPGAKAPLLVPEARE